MPHPQTCWRGLPALGVKKLERSFFSYSTRYPGRSLQVRKGARRRAARLEPPLEIGLYGIHRNSSRILTNIGQADPRLITDAQA